MNVCSCSLFTAVAADGTETRTGCTATTRRTFAPGHDARLKGFLIRAGREGKLIRTPEGGADQVATRVADRFGFGQMVREGVARKAAKRVGKAAKPVTPRLVTAKVGRWVYTGTMDDRGNFTYTQKNGQTHTTALAKVQS
jgi:hypothetical protein